MQYAIAKLRSSKGVLLEMSLISKYLIYSFSLADLITFKTSVSLYSVNIVIKIHSLFLLKYLATIAVSSKPFGFFHGEIHGRTAWLCEKDLVTTC